MVLASIGSVLVGIGALALLIVPRWVEARVLAEARERGVELVPGAISYGIGWVRIEDARLSLREVAKLSMRVEQIDIALSGLSPTRFTLENLRAEALGDLLPLLQNLRAWADANGSALEQPVWIKPLSVRLGEAPEIAPRISIDGAELQIQGDRAVLTAKQVHAFGRSLGVFRIYRQGTRVRLDLPLAHGSLDKPTLSLALAEEKDGIRKIDATLAPILVSQVGAILDLPLPEPSVEVSGRLGVLIPSAGSDNAPVRGRTEVVLKGYLPPHPAELNGFVFGDTTQVGAGFLIEPERLRVVIDPATLRAGRFELQGKGEIVAEGLDARLTLFLSGSLPCNALAGAAAETRLGSALGRVAGKAARTVVSGSVGVRILVEVKASSFSRPQILKTITPGCGLKALTLKELVQLGELVPEAARPEVARDFERLLEQGLPPMPGPGISLRLPGLGTLLAPAKKEAPNAARSDR